MTKEAKIILIITCVALGGLIWLISRNAPLTSADLTRLVLENSHMTAKKEAKVTIVEFGDFQCPACGYAHPIMKQVLAAYKDNPNVNFVARNFPLSIHFNAKSAAEAAEAAGEQGKYWEMYDKLYENQSQWSTASDPTDIFAGYARELGLDAEKLKTAVENNQFNATINQDMADGNAVGVSATPTFFINGTKFEGALSVERFKQEIDSRLNQ